MEALHEPGLARREKHQHQLQLESPEFAQEKAFQVTESLGRLSI